jgi:cysteinyl-tRNA synthetase
LIRVNSFVAVWVVFCSFGVLANHRVAIKTRLSGVKNWVYVIQDVETDQQREALVGTHFDLYVLEPVVTNMGMRGFDIVGLIRDIKRYNMKSRDVEPIVLAYVDIGQAEEWRWYWKKGWSVGHPGWIVGKDPDNWEGNYPVAYWDIRWERIMVYGDGGRSHVKEILKAGFDGIYMDWVEAFSDVSVINRVKIDFNIRSDETATQKAADLMLDFIAKIRKRARTVNSDFLLVAQNASDLFELNPKRYQELIDGIALEAIWYDGDNGFDNWSEKRGYNIPTNEMNPGWTEEVLEDLVKIREVGIPIFCAEYAQDTKTRRYAEKVYNTLAPGVCIPYTTRRSLKRLSTTPYPKGYRPHDY